MAMLRCTLILSYSFLSFFPDYSQFHFYYRYFAPVCQEIAILFSSTHGMDFYNTYIYSLHSIKFKII